MPSFSLTDAAFEGFRFTRERPGAVATWAAATFAFNLAAGVLGALVGGDALRAFDAASRQPDLAAGLAALVPALPAVIIVIAVQVVGCAVVYASALRSFIGIDRKVGFRLGEDERRLGLLLIGYGLVAMAVTPIGGMVIGFVENIAAGFSASAVVVLRAIAPILLFLLPPAVIVPFSLAPVIAVDRKRIDLKESWVSTKGHYWPLAGSLALSFVLFVIVAVVALMLVMLLTEALSLGTGGAIATPGELFNPSQPVGRFITPAVVFGEIGFAVVVGVLLPVLLGPLVRAYQAYDAPDPRPRPARA